MSPDQLGRLLGWVVGLVVVGTVGFCALTDIDSPRTREIGGPGTLAIVIPDDAPANSLPDLAKVACGDAPVCTVMAWRDFGEAPSAMPLTPEQTASMAFRYIRDRNNGTEERKWNCDWFPRTNRDQCLS